METSKVNEHYRAMSPELFATPEEPEELPDSPAPKLNWRGSNMSEIYHRKSPWDWDPPPIQASPDHTVLFQLPVPKSGPFVPRFSCATFCWDREHVRMPFSPENLYPVDAIGGPVLKKRWDLIVNAFSQPIKNSETLEKAIFSYNKKYAERWKFSALHHFFNEALNEDETDAFFENILPKIITLALKLPELLPSSVPLLKKNKKRTISLTQLQIASLLANAFLCTFPRRNTYKNSSEYGSYPDINFNRLFQCYNDNAHDNVNDTVVEKLKCICNYFRRVSNKEPEGVVTFERRCLELTALPQWGKSDKSISSMLLHITDKGTIDGDGLGLLQVDFANRYVGGGVLGRGCVQEEIRFVLCPELIVSRLFTQELEPTEALLITGVEQYNSSEGYAGSFLWNGNYVDRTPRDAYGRRKCFLVAIDALHFSNSSEQFKIPKMLRELNKAYVGYMTSYTGHKPAVATGNWGCGAFRGDPHLKALLQLMATRCASRDLVYYTFGHKKLRDEIHQLFTTLSENNVTVGQLWNCLIKFSDLKLPAEQLYSFIIRTTTGNRQPSSRSTPVNVLVKRKREMSDPLPGVSDKISRTPNTNIDTALMPSEKMDTQELEVSLNSTASSDSDLEIVNKNYGPPPPCESKAKNSMYNHGSVLLARLNEMENPKVAHSTDMENQNLRDKEACVIDMEVTMADIAQKTKEPPARHVDRSSTAAKGILHYFKPKS